MTTETTARCLLGVTDRTLSDFRSDGLGAKETERLRAHIAQCSACQARLDEYEALARALRAQPEPDGHAQLWQSVRASITEGIPSSPAKVWQGGRPRGARRTRSAQLWTAFGSIAAVVALSVGFVTLFVSHGGRPPAAKTTPTPITVHSGSLTWRQIIGPRGFPGADQVGADNAATNTAALVAPTDGKTAYACQADKRKVSSPVVWATHDAGASWPVITPADLPANTGGCRIVLDDNDANTLIVSFFPVLSPSQPAHPDQWVTYATFDGGATWTKPAGLQNGNVTFVQATARGTIYALRGPAAANGDMHLGLYASHDGMQTWTLLDATLPETRPNLSEIPGTGRTFYFWANASTGEVLDLATSGSLWSTVDDGAHWTKLAYPSAAITSVSHAPRILAGMAASGAYMTICAVFDPVQSSNDPWLECTTDDGKSWHQRPSPAPGHHMVPERIGADGSIYAVSFGPGPDSAAMYRLPVDGTTTADWQRLGAIPGTKQGSCSAFPAPYTTDGAVVFWTTPCTNTTTDNMGKSVTTAQPYYYVATYP